MSQHLAVFWLKPLTNIGIKRISVASGSQQYMSACQAAQCLHNVTATDFNVVECVCVYLILYCVQYAVINREFG